jgi:hypothetical protein
MDSYSPARLLPPIAMCYFGILCLALYASMAASHSARSYLPKAAKRRSPAGRSRTLGAGGADRELLLLVGRAGDLGEALLDGGTDCCGVSRHGTVLVGSCSLVFGVIVEVAAWAHGLPGGGWPRPCAIHPRSLCDFGPLGDPLHPTGRARRQGQAQGHHRRKARTEGDLQRPPRSRPSLGTGSAYSLQDNPE